MTKISSGSMFFLKRVFPVLWYGYLAVFVGAGMTSAVMKGPEPGDLFFVAVPAFMAAVGYVVMRQFIWDLVDEVYDCGDSLVIRDRGDETRIALADIMNVSASTHVNPPRITLRLTQPGRFGKEVSFSPIRPFTLNPFAKNEIAESLIERVDRARSKRAL